MSPRTLTVRLNARLGNQMFEYAFARALSLQMGIDRCYMVGSDTNRLDCFALSEHIFFSSNYPSFSWITRFASRIMGKLAAIFAQKPKLLYHIEQILQPIANLCGVHFCLDGYLLPQLSLLKANHLYCSGYFQSERYFFNHSDVIRRDFTFLPFVTEPCEFWANQIRTCNSVCLHVRLGDFLTLPQYHVCNADYYQRAIALMRLQQPDAHFFLFSDEPDRAIRLIHVPDVTIIPSTLTDQQSLYLGTLCHHHILSNSSFSWWMQYLAHHPTQIVIAPRRWMNDDTPISLYQPHWLTI